MATGGGLGSCAVNLNIGGLGSHVGNRVVLARSPKSVAAMSACRGLKPANLHDFPPRASKSAAKSTFASAETTSDINEATFPSEMPFTTSGLRSDIGETTFSSNEMPFTTSGTRSGCDFSV
jgi:hypothetical protein